jgi:hypothetical protein
LLSVLVIGKEFAKTFRPKFPWERLDDRGSAFSFGPSQLLSKLRVRIKTLVLAFLTEVLNR